MKLTNKVINSFLALCASAALGAGGMYLYNKDKIKSSDKYSLINECERFLKSEGVDLSEEADPKIAALKGYLEAYDDKYMFYSNGEHDESYLASLNSLSCLITCGYKVRLSEDGRIEVFSVSPGSAAEKQGLKTGDIIISIDGEDIAEKGIVPTALNLSGKDGTIMKLVIEREGVEIPLEFVRSNDYDRAIENVNISIRDDVLYVSISNFDKYVPATFNGKIEELDEKYSRIIIDLRENLGGETSASVSFADKFIGKGYVELHHYNGENLTLWTNDNSDDYKLPIVILCNENTASAAEIFTALLKQYGENVTLVGTKTYGKGVFQYEHDLSNGGVLRYTAGYYTVGEWDCYHGVGIPPDVEVEMDRSLIGTDKDVQLEKAISLVG